MSYLAYKACADDKSYAEIHIGYFDSQITLEQSNLIADLIWCFKSDDHNVLSSTFLFEELRWAGAMNLGWSILIQLSYNRKALLPRNIKYEWVIATCPTKSCLGEVIYTGWNLSGNESLIFALTPDFAKDSQRMAQSFESNIGTHEANEIRWQKFCSLVFSRDHDGIALRVYTSILTAEDVLQQMRTLKGLEFTLVDEPL